MGNRRRARPFREVQSVILARTGTGADPTPRDVSTLVAGLSSLLQVGLHLAFYPAPGSSRPTDGDFASNTFTVLGWTADDRGQLVQLASEPVTGTTPIQAPDGWSGRTELEALEVVASLTAIGTDGEWRLIVTLEPSDGCLCQEIFDELVRQVAITAQVPPLFDGPP